MSHSIAGARGTVADREDILRQAQAWGEEKDSEVLLADASAVFGRDHLESAAFHAERARSASQMVTRSVSMEALLYLSGRRQVADAIEAAGLREGQVSIGAVVFGDGNPDELLSRLGWSRDDLVLGVEGKPLHALGLTDRQGRTVSPAAATDLALERTALVDLEK